MKFRVLLSIFVISFSSSILTFAELDMQFVGNISINPATPSVGDIITFTVSIKSEGETVTNLKIIGGIDSDSLYERTFASIPADAVRTVSFTWTSEASDHTVWFELDPDHTTDDSNFGNNRIELIFNGGEKPDLTISAFTLTKDSHRDDKYFYTIMFKNEIGGCVRAFNYKMYSVHPTTGENLCKTCKQGSVAAVSPLCVLNTGKLKVIHGFILKSDFRKNACKYHDGHLKKYNPIYFVVDYDNKVEESNDDNNATDMRYLWWEEDCTSEY